MIMRTVMRQKLGGGYATGPQIVVDTAELAPGEFETMALNEVTGNELAVRTSGTEIEAIKDFWHILWKYAQPLQKAVFSAKMKPGGKYTMVCLSEFGFPTVRKFTFYDAYCSTYAQHYDVIKLSVKPFKKRSTECWVLYEKSFMILEGWHDLPEDFGYELVSKANGVTVTKSKYSCFDAHYFSDMIQLFDKPLCIYRNYKRGVNGKLYA